MSAPVAVTGLSCLCAAGLTLPETLHTLYQGQRNPRVSDNITTDHKIDYPVFEVSPEFKALEGSEQLTRCSQFALVATQQALIDAGYTQEELSGLTVGVAVGTTVDSPLKFEDFYRNFRSSEDPDFSLLEPSLKSNPAYCVKEEWDLNGPCLTVVNACTSGADAIGLGALWIRQGLCDVVIAGGSDALNRVTYNGFRSLQILNDSPCTPFDKNRRGLNLGEGAGMLVLESESQRKRKQHTVKAYLTGYGSATDAHHLTAPKPDGSGLKKAVEEALSNSTCTATELAFINAHGTGTQDNDKVECKVMTEVFPHTPFLSTKGYMGHTLGAAGAIEAALTIACLAKGKLPKSVGFSQEDEVCARSPITENMVIEKKSALSQSLAFGGCNTALIFSVEGI